MQRALAALFDLLQIGELVIIIEFVDFEPSLQINVLHFELGHLPLHLIDFISEGLVLLSHYAERLHIVLESLENVNLVLAGISF